MAYNLGNEFVSYNLLHHDPHQLGTGNSAFFCGLLQILNFQRNDYVLDVHNTPRCCSWSCFPALLTSKFGENLKPPWQVMPYVQQYASQSMWTATSGLH